MNGDSRMGMGGPRRTTTFASRASTVGLGSSRPSVGMSRMSMAPRVGGMAGAMDDMGSFGNRISGISDARMSGIGRNLGPMARRSSQYQGRPSAIGGAPPPMMMKDPRPVREKEFKNEAIRELAHYLMEAGYSAGGFSAKLLQAPSGKDFQAIFRFLYEQLDPTYVYEKRFEEELQVILKGIRYPFADAITKSHLASVGSPHCWPTLLAMLVWMVKVIKSCDDPDSSDDLDAHFGHEDEGVPEKLFFEYVLRTYETFLGGDDNYEAMDSELVATLDTRNEKTVINLKRAEEELERLNEEYEHYTKSEPPVIALSREGDILRSDKDKFRQYIQHVEGKIQKFNDQILTLKEELNMKEKEAAQLAQDKASLQHTVDSQEISPADVDRMTAEREQLHKTLEVIGQKVEEANKAVWEKEIALQKQMDQLEKLIQEYNTSAYKLGLLGQEVLEKDLSVELDLRVHASRPDQMLSVDLPNKAKPALARLRERYKAFIHQAQDDMIALQESLDNLNWTFSQKREELAEAELQIKRLGEQYREQQEAIGVAFGASTDEIQQYERNIQRIKIEASSLVIKSQQRMQKALVDYDQLSRQCEENRERLLNDFAQILVELFNFQQHTHRQLEELYSEVKVDMDEASSVFNVKETDAQ